MGKLSTYITEENRSSFSDRFWSKITISGDDSCWPWTGATGKSKHDQYGKVALPRQSGLPKVVERAHRVSYFIETGIDPDDEVLIVRHRCDNPECCNPNHLLLGTPQDNMNDMKERNRGKTKVQKGKENGNSSLTEADVVNIWKRIDAGETNVAIANTYDVSHSTISAIRRGITWSHVHR